MIRVVLVGLGNIGLGYDVLDGRFVEGQTKTHAKAILESSDFELAGFTDVSPEKITAAQMIVSATNCVRNQILEQDFIPDLAVVAVNTVHHAAVVESLIATPKVLIIEKPAGLNSRECTRISSWGLKNNVQIFVNYFRRYLSCSTDSRLYLSQLETGTFVSAEINAYGSLLNIHSHLIDLGFFLTGQQVFCGCEKKLKNQVGSMLIAFCENCNATFRFGGVNSLKCDISMFLEFEYVEVFISKDGKRIEIVDKVKKISKVFESEFVEYENYQKVVYEKIGEMLRSGIIEEHYRGLEHANNVHLFLESVDLNNAS